MDKTSVIFGNKMSRSVIAKAERKKKRYAGKFGDDSTKQYVLHIEDNESIGKILGVKNMVLSPKKENGKKLDTEHGVIVGNIRMGFGHYRISMAIASAAHAMGYTPYWIDLHPI